MKVSLYLGCVHVYKCSQPVSRYGYSPPSDSQSMSAATPKPSLLDLPTVYKVYKEVCNACYNYFVNGYFFV